MIASVRLFLTAMIVIAVTRLSPADTITLKSGQVIHGTYVGGTTREMMVDVGERIQTLNVNDLLQIEFDLTIPAQETPIAKPAASRAAAASAASNTPGPTPRAASAGDLRKLTDERARLVRSLRSNEAMLSARGMEARATIFCRSQTPATPISDVTLDELEERYAALENSAAATPDQELQRQYQLQTGSDVLSAAYQNLQACVWDHSLGRKTLPTNEQEAADAANIRSRIADIDRELAGRK